MIHVSVNPFFELQPDTAGHNAPPSRVLHVRGLREYATQNDIVDAVKQFGRVTYVMMIPKNRQALVEFDVSISFALVGFSW